MCGKNHLYFWIVIFYSRSKIFHSGGGESFHHGAGKIDPGSVLRLKTVCFVFLVGPGCALCTTSSQHDRNLGPKVEPKSHKNQCQNEDKKSMRLGWAYEAMFLSFGTQLGPMSQVGHRKRIVVKFH